MAVQNNQASGTKVGDRKVKMLRRGLKIELNVVTVEVIIIIKYNIKRLVFLLDDVNLNVKKMRRGQSLN